VLELFHERAPIGILGGDENIGCRAKDAQRLRLKRCAITFRSGRAVIGAGERFTDDRRSFEVDVDLNAAGKALIRKRPRGFAATITAKGVDSAGRTKTVSKRVRLRRGVN
jgi:hypothetical protein